MSAIGVAVVGLGVGERHARAYRADRRAALRWVVDLDRAKAKRVGSELGAPVASDLDQVLDDPRTQAVSLASYDDHHAAQVVACLKAGKHVFVEKPLCRTAAELVAIRKAWSRAKRLHLQSNLILRAAPLYQWLRKRIDAGAFGDLYAIDGDYLYGRLNKILDGWRGAIRGYSVMAGGGVHLVDLLLTLAGSTPTSVQARGNRIVTAGTRFRSPDYVAATYEFRSGLIGRITANFGCVHRHQHVVRVFGSKATFFYDDRGPRLYSKRDPGGPARVLGFSPIPASKGALIPGFLEAISRGENPRRAAEREFDLMRCCLASDLALSVDIPTPIE